MEKEKLFDQNDFYNNMNKIMSILSNNEKENKENQIDIEYIPDINIKLEKEDADPMNVASYMINHIYDKRIDTNDKNYFCFMQNEISEYSVIGDFVNSFYNPYAASMDLSEGTAKVENSLLDFFAKTAGYDKEKYGGQFVSGASMGNLTSLIAARDDYLAGEEIQKGTIYLSDQAHSSLIKAGKIIGLKEEHIRIISSDDNLKMNVEKCKHEIEKDLERGLIPFCIVGTLGTTNAGAIDPLEGIASLAQNYNLWFHVDAAYGGSVLLSSYKYLAFGVEKSDSMTWDAHKWLFQTYGCGIVLCKDKKNLLRSFSTNPEYLEDIESNEEKTNFWDLGIEMTRPARGMKLWYTLKVMGIDKVKEIVDRSIIFGEKLETMVNESSNLEIITKANLGIINIRYVDSNYSVEELNQFNKYISKRMLENGQYLFMTTTIKGLTTLRFNFKNPNTDIRSFRLIFQKIEELANTYFEKEQKRKVVG